MHPQRDAQREYRLAMTRRQLLGRTATGIGTAALASLLDPQLGLAAPAAAGGTPGVLESTHHPAKAKRVIYLFQSGGPSHIDTWDYKRELKELHKTELPDSVRMGQRLTGMTAGQKSFPVAAPIFEFQRYGQCGTWASELVKHTAELADDICVVKSVHTEAINHDPAITYIQTGHQQPGRPSIGAWLSYGLGSDNQNLPAYVVLISRGSAKRDAQAIFSRLWGSGFVPSSHQGVKFRSQGDPVLYLSNPPGIDGGRRREMLDTLGELNRLSHDAFGDPEIATRIKQYELAYRMQTSVPELMDVSQEPEHVFEMYGPNSRTPGTFAANCLLARRMAERGVRFIQLFHRGWDQHGNLPRDIRLQFGDTDQPAAALIKDLKARGMLDETLIVWAGEFGRTVYSQGTLTKDNYGRDHHGRCFSVWLAGGGIKGGMTYGQTDAYCYNVVENPVHIHDLNATILHCLGIDHERLTYKFQGRYYRLTDVHGNVVKPILA